MSVRVISLATVLVTGFMVYLLVSHAPVRVHVATGLAWAPSLAILFVLAWTSRLSNAQKILAIGFMLPVAGGLIAYSTAVAVTKVAFGAKLWLANTVLFFVVACSVAALTRMCEKIWELMQKL